LLTQSSNQLDLRFSVRDTGIGIPADRLDRLFQPFSQVDGSITRRFGGTGLGLAISRQIVAMMHGEIGVESQADVGSTFWFTARFGKIADPAPALATLPTEPFLLMGAVPETQHVLLDQLRHWGLHVEYLASGPSLEAGIAALRERFIRADDRPAAVLVDHPDLREARHYWLEHLQTATSGSALLVELTALGDNAVSDTPGYLRLTKPLRRDSFVSLFQNQQNTAPNPALVVPLHKRLLLVEDNAINQRVAIGLLAKLGYAVDIAQNGMEALERLETTEYDLVLMDCHMPGMDGFATTEAIRRTETASRHIPIIALTADALPEDEARCLAAGMDGYLSKPINRDALQAALIRWLS
jgi:CheY-like chemotaxis protein